MFAILPPPTATPTPPPPPPQLSNPFTTMIPSANNAMSFEYNNHNRPIISSPLSSPPAAINNHNNREFAFSQQDHRQTQSSPLAPSSQSSNPNTAKLFRFASTPFRGDNPLTSKKRDQVRDTKRRLFLANVRQRQEDKRWERRGGMEDEILKLEFYRLDRERKERMILQQQHQQFVEPDEFEDILAKEEEDDARMVDFLESQEREEVDALLERLEGEGEKKQLGKGYDDDHEEFEEDDYDGLFMEMISSQQQQQQQGEQRHEQQQQQQQQQGWDGQDVEMS
ncbi:hypothetical protein QBC43DRAFT_301865 [Cladorrhinum sp. PSN259]|nr:hypothetical protein QBC43DRAFT_301865 [Cladorrhinum sp. PSN259]